MTKRIFEFIAYLVLTILIAQVAFAQETSICAAVRIEIAQELTFERQAFDASMRITNSLTQDTINNVDVTIHFKDEFGLPVTASSNPNASGAAFFLAQPTLSGINSVSGSGVIQPESVAEIHWLIIPAPDAAGGLIEGKLYFIGATLTYEVNGAPTTLDVADDFITVKPPPILDLDYFLPINVRADIPGTPQIEPPVPFTLGVRIMNSGLAPAVNTRIESSQPHIVDNQLGLLIGFTITGSFVDDNTAAPTLSLNFGDISSGTAKTGRWVMQTSLSGTFSSFSATFSHADELGGQLTSLLNSVNTHLLIKDVRVDLPGRDTIKDFLASDAGLIKLYESHGLDTLVLNQSSGLSLVSNGSTSGTDHYYVDVPVTSGPLYVKLPDPYNGTRAVVNASRNDGKTILLDNAWFSVEGLGPNYSYYFNLFDVNGGGRYFIDAAVPQIGPVPPTMQLIPNYSITAGQLLSFVVFASDPNGTTPMLSIDTLPLGASFVDNGNGSGTFSWPTSANQAGSYPVTFRASDGVLQSAQTPLFYLLGQGDSDGDGLPDSWEVSHFGNLSQSATGDYDNDGLTNLQEFQLGTDPTLAANAPSVPFIDSPLPGRTVTNLQPILQVLNSTHGVEIPTYKIEVYSDNRYSALITSSPTLPEGNITTSWQVDTSLIDNNWYYWRAKAALAGAASEWVYGRFFVNSANDLPSVPATVFPTTNDSVDSRSPKLTVSNATDLDGDELRYKFEVEALVQGSPQIFASSYITEGTKGTTSWVANIPAIATAPFSWRATVSDSTGSVSTAWVPFNLGSGGSAPTTPLPLSPIEGSRVSLTGLPVDLVAKVATDAETPTGLTYSFEISPTKNFTSPTLVPVTSAPYSGATPFVVKAAVSGLLDHTKYYWRVRAFDGVYYGPWISHTFFTDASNDSPTTPLLENPGNIARVDSYFPELAVTESIGPDDYWVAYYFEIYGDPLLTSLIDSGVSSVPYWKTAISLGNHTKYYWRARVKDDRNLFSSWSPTKEFFVSVDAIDDPPKIRATRPPINLFTSFSRGGEMEWEDADPDSDATIFILVNGSIIDPGRKEDRDNFNDILNVRPLYLSPGIYTANVIIHDGVNFDIDTSCCTVTIDPPTLLNDDSDGDGILDGSDNCPFRANPSQSDSGGVGGNSPDGIGDSCQCGDVTGDGVVDSVDVNMISQTVLEQTSSVLLHPELCNVFGGEGCSQEDATFIQNSLNTLPAGATGEPFAKLCEASRR